VALPDFLQLCRISGCLYSAHEVNQQPFWLHRQPNLDIANFSYDIFNDLFIRRTFQDPAGYPRILGIVDLRPLRGRHACKASLRSALPDSLQPCWEIWVSLLFIRSKTMTVFLLFLEHQTSHAFCFNARGLLYGCVFDALLFSLSY
jgi:hypothetical protein